MNKFQLDKKFCKNTPENLRYLDSLGFQNRIVHSTDKIGICCKSLSFIGLEGTEFYYTDLHLCNAPYNHWSDFTELRIPVE